MKSIVTQAWILVTLILMSGLVISDEPLEQSNRGIRIMSWNISDDAFVSNPAAFGALLRRADPDILLLDEVAPAADAQQLRRTLTGLRPGNEAAWHINYGVSGGRQRGVIASRSKQETLPEFSAIVPYPEDQRKHILKRMPAHDSARRSWTMDGGIPLNGALILTGKQRLLVVVADLQCCGDGPGSWQEYRRRVEMQEIRRLIRQVMARTHVDGLVVAGDFNLISTGIPLVILAGPYDEALPGLIPVEIYHLDGSTSWTWDGRGTPFPSRALDFQLYSPRSLIVRQGLILDSEDFPAEELEQYGLQPGTSGLLSDHRPLVVEYAWR
jgi:hypothetical protein